MSRKKKTKVTGKTPVLLMDGAGCHRTVRMWSALKGKGVEGWWLPPNKTWLLSPLDVSAFGVVKRGWRAVQEKYHGEVLSPRDFVYELASVLTKVLEGQAIDGGWRGSGLFPVSWPVIERAWSGRERGLAH